MSSLPTDQQFEDLLAYLKQSRGFDFTAYKHASLLRRVQRRMDMVHVERFDDYTAYLEAHPDEFRSLFNMILINVTGFFRDAPSWEYLGSEIIPAIVAAKKPDDQIRVWSAGCASGEEPYSLAMLLVESLGLEQYKQRVKIYATDVDDEALNQARQATYRGREVHDSVPPALLEKYFEPQGERFAFNKELRRSVIFGRHDLLQDAPISRVSLLVCRNCLMYFNAEAQGRVLERLHFAVEGTGYLFLGKAEMLFLRQDMFRSVDLRRRVFVKVGRAVAQGVFTMAQTSEGEEATSLRGDTNLIRALAFDSDPIAQVSVDAQGLLVLANSRARTLFNLTSSDLGRALREMEMSHRPFPVRTLLDRATTERISLTETECQLRGPSGDVTYYDVQVTPLTDATGQPSGYHLTFRDVSKVRQLRDALKHTNQELETAYEEIQSTNEELETTNEELQSSNEELETTNEELQSTNEELETMNEELQSTNEELQSANEELRHRSDELNQVNGFLESILSSMPDGVVVLDGELRVLAWNVRAEDLWGLRNDEVRGKHFLNLDIGLPVLQLTQPIRACTNDTTRQEVVVDATNRRGKSIAMRVVCSKLLAATRSGDPGVLLVMQEVFDGASALP
jgi:two-component system, chemotaxis family, CheB/CheR fusion protein